MLLGGEAASIPLPFDNCVVPEGINGPVAIFVTSDSQPLVNNVRDRASTQLVAGPTFAFIDTQPQMLNQLARVNLNVAGATSTSTRTISPGEATSIISGASTVETPSLNSPPPSTANTATGASVDGAITVVGWTNVPA